MPRRAIITAAALALVAAAGFEAGREHANAQQAPAQATIKRTILQKSELPGSDYEIILGIAEVPPGVAIGRHTHFGVEMGTLIEGEAVMLIDGAPERTMKPGDSYQVPAEVPHDAKTGAKPAKVIAVYVVKKGQPFATPAR